MNRSAVSMLFLILAAAVFLPQPALADPTAVDLSGYVYEGLAGTTMPIAGATVYAVNGATGLPIGDSVPSDQYGAYTIPEFTVADSDLANLGVCATGVTGYWDACTYNIVP